MKHDGAGFVTRFEVESEFLSRYPVQQAGGRAILELWVPAEELDDFNAHIVGWIQVVHEFRRGGQGCRQGALRRSLSQPLRSIMRAGCPVVRAMVSKSWS